MKESGDPKQSDETPHREARHKLIIYGDLQLPTSSSRTTESVMGWLWIFPKTGRVDD